MASPDIAHKTPTSAHGKDRVFVVHEGRRFALTEEKERGWRLRSRSKHHPIDLLLGPGPEKWARSKALAHLRESGPTIGPATRKARATLEDLVELYESMPKRAGAKAAKISVYRLRSVVRTAYSQELKDVSISRLTPALWLAYTAKRQGLPVADLATRRAENRSINAAMRQASAVFAPKLRPAYQAEGVVLRPDATLIQWLPEMHKAKPPADLDKLDKAWRALKEEDLQKWIAIGLARFAGLRRDEIENARKTWVEVDGVATFIRIQDRPEQHWTAKTAKPYRALVLDESLAEVLRALPDGRLVNPKAENRQNWFERKLQEWVRPFVGNAQMPLHRLRGLYADHLAKLTEDAVAAKLAAQKKVKENLGHTSEKTAIKHYLTED